MFSIDKMHIVLDDKKTKVDISFNDAGKPIIYSTHALTEKEKKEILDRLKRMADIGKER